MYNSISLPFSCLAQWDECDSFDYQMVAGNSGVNKNVKHVMTNAHSQSRERSLK